MSKFLRLVVGVSAVQAVVFLGAILLAGTITRSTKPGSTTSFATSRDLGNTLGVADLDTDINTAYTCINGNIESANIAADTITAADIATGGVTTTEILDGTVSSTDIANGTIVNADVSATANIDVTKILATGFGSGACTTGATAITSETTIATAVMTGTGGDVLLIGGCATSVILIGGGTTNVTWRWKRDAVLIGPVIYPLSGVSTLGTSIRVPVPPPTFVDVNATAGAHTYTLTVETDTGIIQTAALFAGSIQAKEITP